MIKTYLIERRSWILLFICQQLLILFVAYMDPTIPLQSILYMVFLSMIVFTVFLMIRYHTETRFYKSLEERDNNLDLTSIASPESPFEKIIDTSMTNQIELLKRPLRETRSLWKKRRMTCYPGFMRLKRR